MPDVDFIEEIHIAQYWRKQLGEYEYVYYNPDDLRRWYIALKLRGPDDIRSYLIERSSRHPDGMVTGIVAVAPHPPRAIVELWLKSHEGFRSSSYWTALATFVGFIVIAVPYLHGCTTLTSLDKLAMHPKQTGLPLQPGQFGQPAPANSTLPDPGPPPAASVASPPAARTGATH